MNPERLLITMKNKIKSAPNIPSNKSINKLEIDKIIL